MKVGTMDYEQLIIAERMYLAQLLRELKPKQWKTSTLCEGWDIEDLVAHIIVRDGGPLLARIGIIFPPLADRHNEAIGAQKSAAHQILIDKIEHIPWRGKNFRYNLIEFFVHNEDILRGQLKRTRDISDDLYAGLASFVPAMARLGLRKLDPSVRVTLVDSLTGDVYVARRGRGTDPHELTLTAEAPEFILLFMNRGRVADVRADGDKKTLDIYKHAQIGL
ncbi:maleylpyruvate isomerase family mycothiol-dependent enzyme [bacterium]|nr:maleylpyruvate isomerase family mycothiol-dependent enzyme [bacterium]